MKEHLHELKKCVKLLALSLLMAFAFTMAKAQQQVSNGQWKGFEKVSFIISGHQAYYVKPTHPLEGKPWVWRSSFPDWHTDMDSILLVRGFYVAYINVDDQYGSPQSLQVWDVFYRYLTTRINLSPKPALEAVSRGALYAYGWAKRNPDKVSCIYAETPVCDFKSWPGGKGKGPGDTAAWSQLKKVYHFTESEALLYKDNPVDNLEGLAAFHVPNLHVISLNDQLAPPSENSYVFAHNYIEAGGPITIYPITDGPQELKGHHFPIRRPEYFADFIFKNSYPVKVLPYNDYIVKSAGLGRFFDVAAKTKKATVTFLGGSITYNPGWRQEICRYLTERFPDTKFHFIAAGIPSLGSLPHAFRLQRDVLDSGKTDLLFVEAAVNDRVNGTDSITQVRALEGIVRHAKKSNPDMDIALMAFADPDKTNDYNKGITPVEIKNHQMVAQHYGLPFINLAKEVHDKMANKEFNWNDDFKDLHPAVFGEELYFESIKAMLQECFEVPKSASTKLPVALDKGNLAKGRYFDVKNAKHDNGWTYTGNWKPTDGLAIREGFVNVPVLSADKPGTTLTLPFNGNAVGIAIVSGSNAGEITYSIDGGTEKTIDLYTQWSGMLHLPWYLLLGADLKEGKHVLKISISDKKNQASKGNACRIVHFLVNE